MALILGTGNTSYLRTFRVPGAATANDVIGAIYWSRNKYLFKNIRY